MDFIAEIFNPSSIWSVVARGLLWLLVASVIIISVDSVEPQKSLKQAKSNLGILILFIGLSSTLFYFLFNFTS
ncbi:MAG TPA: hypothetical protein PKX78_03335 [Candidatus Woesebacteria bacterium]|jgi:hypothetical protein|nr:hypothetical protein [Candidatus Woesebacteria bacterium]